MCKLCSSILCRLVAPTSLTSPWRFASSPFRPQLFRLIPPESRITALVGDHPAMIPMFLQSAPPILGWRRAYVLELGEETRLKFWILLANAKGGYSPGSSETILEQDLTALREGGADELVDRLRQPVGAWFFSEVRDSFHAEGEAARGRVGYIAAEPCLPPVCRGGRQTRFHGPRRHRGSMTRQVKSRPKPLSARLARILRWTLCVSRSRLAGNPHPKSGSTFLLFPRGKARKIVGW